MREDEARTILGVGPDADQEALKKAYRAAMLRHHPDKGGDSGACIKVGEAHELLRSRLGSSNENKPDNNDDPRSPNNNDRFLEGTHVMLHGFSTKGPHYNGLFGVVASASKDGWHKVTLGPPHSETVPIKIENLDYLYRSFDSCEYCHKKCWLDMRFEQNVIFMSGRFCSMQCWQKACKSKCYAPRKRPYDARPATPPPRRRPREDEPRTPDTLPKRQRRASYKRWLNEGEQNLMGFGKYEGKTFAWVLENRPDYVAWVEKNVSPSPAASQEEFVAWLDSEERWGS